MYGEREQETIVEADYSVPEPAEVLALATAVRPDGVQLDSHRGSLTTGIAASATTAPGF